jgi:hypothetical protein
MIVVLAIAALNRPDERGEAKALRKCVKAEDLGAEDRRMVEQLQIRRLIGRTLASKRECDGRNKAT